MAKKHKTPSQSAAPSTPGRSWSVHFFQRHTGDDPSQAVPARDFLDRCPTVVAAKLLAVVKAVADAPPPVFGGGGKWEAMHGSMGGFYEVRTDGPGRHHYRLFCLLDRNGAAVGLGGPSLILVAGKDKPFRTELSDADYGEVRALGQEFLSRNPRSVVR